LEDLIPTPKKPQKLLIILTQEEFLKFLASVRSIKHRTILTTCYAAGLRVSEAICLKVTDIDSERMLRCHSRKWLIPPLHPVPRAGWIRVRIRVYSLLRKNALHSDHPKRGEWSKEE
jgi:integrase